jgi:hypothetical protein
MASETVLISWNATNWITIMLMVIIAFLIFGAIAGLWHRVRGTSDAAS